MIESIPMFVVIEIKKIREFIDCDIDDIDRDVIRRTIHQMLDRVCDAYEYRCSEYQKQIAKQAEIMAETARRNVRLEAALKPVIECDEYVPCGDVDIENTSGALDAVRKAQRIYKKGSAK